MKKFRILGIIAILVFIVDFVFSFANGIEEASDSFMEGMDSGYKKEHPYDSFRSINVEVKPLETTRLDSLANSLVKENVPYKIKEIRVPFVTSIWSCIIMFFGTFAGFAVLGGLYCLVRLLISISKRDVFTPKNVVRMRFFTYSLVAFSFLHTLIEWFDYIEVVRQITFPGYEVKSFGMSADWVLLIVVVLFTEIFAVGVKMKEEQDLTV